MEAEALGAGMEERVAVPCYLQTEGAAALHGSACQALCQEPPEALAVCVDFCEVGDHVGLSPPLALSTVSGTRGVPWRFEG